MATQRELRLAAAAAGKKTYNSGAPCRNGHFCDRYVSTGGCLECVNLKPMTGSGVTHTLVAMQLEPVLVAHDLLPQMRDMLVDVIADAVERWHGDMGMVTLERIAGWKAAAVSRHGKRQLRDNIVAAAAAPTPPTPAMSEKRKNAERFLEVLVTLDGAALDRATELIRQTGEPDNAFRARIKAKTLQNLGT